jgi:hypothetical protein
VSAVPFAYVCDTYGVPAAVGRRVTVDGEPGVIAEDRGHYIGVSFDANKPGDIRSAHPTWKVEYLGMGRVRSMTRSQRRYVAFLDADSDLRFGEWLKCSAGSAA